LDAASVFGQLWRLEPFTPEQRAMWQREMKWLLSVSDHIMELVPSWQMFPDGSTLEVRMTHSFGFFLGAFPRISCLSKLQSSQSVKRVQKCMVVRSQLYTRYKFLHQDSDGWWDAGDDQQATFRCSLELASFAEAGQHAACMST
jgi:hypothetical protein